MAGAPSKYDPTMCQDLIGLMAEGASKTAVAVGLGICKDTLYQWTNPESEYFKPELSDALKIGMAKAQVWWEDLSMKAAKGEIPNANATLIIFNMKNRFRDDWADRQTVENTHLFAVSDTPQKTEKEWLADSRPK